MTQQINEEYRNLIGYELTLRLAQAIKNQEISVLEAPYVSKFILNNIDHVKNREDMVTFLAKLAKDWPFFNDVLNSDKLNKKTTKKQ